MAIFAYTLTRETAENETIYSVFTIEEASEILVRKAIDRHVGVLNECADGNVVRDASYDWQLHSIAEHKAIDGLPQLAFNIWFKGDYDYENRRDIS